MPLAELVDPSGPELEATAFWLAPNPANALYALAPHWHLVLGGFAFGLVFMAIGIIGDGTFALLAGRARDWFARSPARMERIGGTGGAMMLALGVGVLFTGRPD